jgi:hypothetical protein
LSRYFRDQTPLSFLSVIVTGRGDAEPIVSNLKEDHARNRRVEITVVPLSAPFRAQEPKTADTTGAPDPTATAATDASAPAKKTDPSAGKPTDKAPAKKTQQAH